MEAKSKKEMVKRVQDDIRERQAQERQEKKERKEEQEKRRIENERKAEIVQVILKLVVSQKNRFAFRKSPKSTSSRRPKSANSAQSRCATPPKSPRSDLIRRLTRLLICFLSLLSFSTFREIKIKCYRFFVGLTINSLFCMVKPTLLSPINSFFCLDDHQHH